MVTFARAIRIGKMDNFTDDFEISVGENEIFVLGDNRVNSLDSRELGCFKIENVLSKKGIILFPFNHMKGMN